MKNFKMLGLAVALTVASLMTVGPTASAATLTSPEGTTYTSAVVASSSNMKLYGPFVTVECADAGLQAFIKEHGSASDAGGPITSLTFTSCTHETTVKVAGSMDIDGNGNFDLFDTEIMVKTSVGTCVFSADPALLGGTYMGNLTEGSGAAIDFSLGEIDRTGGNFLCGSKGYLKGSWSVTAPTKLWVD